MPAVLGGCTGRHHVEVAGKRVTYIRLGMVGTAEARAGRLLVEDDEIAAFEPLPFGVSQALQ